MARSSKPTARRKSRDGRDDGKAKRKSCAYCRDKIEQVDYKQFNALRMWMSEKGKIRARRVTGLCRRHQRQASVAIKRSREVALVPYVGH